MLRPLRVFGPLLFLSLAACSGSTAGTGEEPVDTGSLLDDTGSLTEDTGSADTGSADTGSTDSTVVDSTALDSGADASDSTVTDAPTEVGETGSTETGSDGATESSTDTGSADTGSADTGSADTGSADTGSDTGTVTGLFPVAGKVSCSGDGTTFCASGQVCCGRFDVLAFKWGYKCDTSCIAARGFDCDETADCPGKVCCADTPPFSSSIQGSTCRTSCGGDPQLCMKDADCGGAKKCSPEKAPDLGITIGVCK